MIAAWSLLARQDLERLRSYIAVDDRDAAMRMGERIVRAAELLEAFPYLGRAGRVANTRELVVPHTPYLLIYRLHQRNLQILRVLHGAQRWP